MEKKGKIYIGTSGFHYKHWVGRFYPEEMKPKSFMAFYLDYFSTVELNSPFYHLPSYDAFKNWQTSTPPDFQFAVKGSRFITHMKKLSDCKAPLENFMQNADGLEGKLGPILFQLPPRWKLNENRFRDFLKLLPVRGYRFTFEFRNDTWYDEAIYQLLEEYNIAFCVYELEYHTSPLKVTADFVYIRLHGPETKYAGNYSNEALQMWADRCMGWQNEGKDVYVYFDNDQNAYAAFNAQKLNELTLSQPVLQEVK